VIRFFKGVRVTESNEIVDELLESNFDPEEVERNALSSISLKGIGFKPVEHTDEKKWTKTLGISLIGEGKMSRSYYAEVFLPNEQFNPHRLHIVMLEQGVTTRDIRSSLLLWKDVSNVSEVSGWIDTFVRRVGKGTIGELSSGEQGPKTIVESIDPEELKQVAHAALSQPWTAWFRTFSFSYEATDGSFFKMWNDNINLGWSYLMKVVPVSMQGEAKFDVTWKFRSPERPTYHAFEWLRDVDLETVGVSHSYGVKKIFEGNMAYEATRI